MRYSRCREKKRRKYEERKIEQDISNAFQKIFPGVARYYMSAASILAFRETNSLQVSKRQMRAAHINEVLPLQGEKKKEI